MDLKNKFGDTILKIDYQLVGFDELRKIILSKVKHLDKLRLANNFISSWYNRGILSDIKDVVLKNDKDSKGNLISTVFLEFDDRKPVKISGMQGGSLVVYESIKIAWEKNQRISANKKLTQSTKPFVPHGL